MLGIGRSVSVALRTGSGGAGEAALRGRQAVNRSLPIRTPQSVPCLLSPRRAFLSCPPYTVQLS